METGFNISHEPWCTVKPLLKSKYHEITLLWNGARNDTDQKRANVTSNNTAIKTFTDNLIRKMEESTQGNNAEWKSGAPNLRAKRHISTFLLLYLYRKNFNSSTVKITDQQDRSR